MTTLLAPITQRSPTVTPEVTTTLAPHQTLSPIVVGPLLVNPCHVTGLSGSSKRWAPSVTKQPLANMQWSPIVTRSTAATITPMFRNVPGADLDPRLVRRGQPHLRLEQRALPHHQPALAQRLEHVALDRPAGERAPACHLAVDGQAIPRQRVALVPAPLLQPQLGPGAVHGVSFAEA